jgi:hypothetical protein
MKSALIKWISGSDARRKEDKHLQVEEVSNSSKARKICLGHIDGDCFPKVFVNESDSDKMLSLRTRTATDYVNRKARIVVGLS